MQNRNQKQFHHKHHVRASMIAIVVATGFHVSGLAHVQGNSRTHESAISLSRVLSDHTERENETSRHMVRFDEGLRLPSTSGGSA